MKYDHRIEPWLLGLWINGGWAFLALNDKGHIHWVNHKRDALQFARAQDVSRMIVRLYGNDSRQMSPMQQPDSQDSVEV